MTVNTVVESLQAGLLWPPALAVIVVSAGIAWLLLGWRLAVLAVLTLRLWKESMETIARVTAAVAISVLVAVPLGVLAARRPRLEAALRPILDILQTVPP